MELVRATSREVECTCELTTYAAVFGLKVHVVNAEAPLRGAVAVVVT